MKVHLLNCGSMKAHNMVATCLFIETQMGIILVDSGLGQWCHNDPVKAYGMPFVKITRPFLDPKEYAINQLSKFGYKTSDVQHIVITHLDLDHTGGLADFPKAKVHVLADEFYASQNRTNWKDKKRYKPSHWEYKPEWVLHEVRNDHKWFGFDASPIFPNIPHLLMVRLKGHSAGHIGVAMPLNENKNPKWLLHSGDALMLPEEIDPVRPRTPLFIKLSPAHGWGLYEGFHETQALIRAIQIKHSDEVILINSHSISLYQQAQKKMASFG